MNEEYKALIRNKTWTLATFPVGKKLIGYKWVHKLKRNTDGSIARYKAILVAKGYDQASGFDFSEIFSSLVKPTTIKIILSLADTNGWIVSQLDVNNVFLNGDLDEEFFMIQPLGFEVYSNQHLVCKLSKALYGLK